MPCVMRLQLYMTVRHKLGISFITALAKRATLELKSNTLGPSQWSKE